MVNTSTNLTSKTDGSGIIVRHIPALLFLLQTSKRPSSGLCFFTPGYMSYHGWKTEIMHTDPDITVFYDVISDYEIRLVKNMAFRLVRSISNMENMGVVSVCVGWLCKTLLKCV